jgi:hypothetical protein
VCAGSVGIKFDDDADTRDLLPRNRVRTALRARPPRLEIKCAASVKIGRKHHQAEIRDISQGGVKMALRDPSCLDQKVVVTVESLGSIAGRVRWCDGVQAGIVWDKPLSFEQLAEWMSKRVEFACVKLGAWERPAG